MLDLWFSASVAWAQAKMRGGGGRGEGEGLDKGIQCGPFAGITSVLRQNTLSCELQIHSHMRAVDATARLHS